MNNLRQTYIDQLKERYPNSPKMVNYCDKRAFAVVGLDNGDVLPIDKYSIKKDFCFGESGYDYDDAIKCAQHARTSKDYFISENLKEAEKDIADIRDDRNHVVLVGRAYDGEAKIAHYSVTTLSNYVQYPWMYSRMRHATDAEKTKIINALELAKADLEKRVKTYLKRYGTSKVHAWTFWLDA